MEYCLWVWELWQSVRGTKVLNLEKELHHEKAERQACAQELVQVSKQVALTEFPVAFTRNVCIHLQVWLLFWN